MTILLTILGLLGITLVWLMIYDSLRFVVVKHEFSHPQIKKNVRAVVLSDLHNKQFGKENELLLDSIRKEKPDFVLIAGDMITAAPRHSLKKALLFLEKLSREFPVYYGNGNHEQRLKLYPDIYQDMADELHAAIKQDGIALLENENLVLPEIGIRIYGLELDRKFYKRRHVPKMEKDYLESCLGEADAENCCVLLAHNPDFFENYCAWGADLVLSGHVHGGIVRVPFWGKGVLSPSVRLFPKYDGGVFEKDNTSMILSRGLGMHTIPFRLFNPGELIVLDFIPKKKDKEDGN